MKVVILAGGYKYNYHFVNAPWIALGASLPMSSIASEPLSFRSSELPLLYER